MLVEVGPLSAPRFDQNGSMFAMNGPMLAKAGPFGLSLERRWSKWVNFGLSWPPWGRNVAHIGQTSPKLGRSSAPGAAEQLMDGVWATREPARIARGFFYGCAAAQGPRRGA